MTKLSLIFFSILFGSNSILNINLFNIKNIENNFDYQSGQKVDIKLEPRYQVDTMKNYELINYGKSGYDSFDEYVNNNTYYSDANYLLEAKIGKINIWKQKNIWLTKNIKTNYIKYLIDNKSTISRTVINLGWWKNERKTTIQIYEYFFDCYETKTIHIGWTIKMMNQNKLDDISFQAYI